MQRDTSSPAKDKLLAQNIPTLSTDIPVINKQQQQHIHAENKIFINNSTSDICPDIDEQRQNTEILPQNTDLQDKVNNNTGSVSENVTHYYTNIYSDTPV